MSESNNPIYLIDTNIFLRFILHDNNKMHQETERLFTYFHNCAISFFTSGVVINEIVWTLTRTYKRSKGEIIPIVIDLLDNSLLRVIDTYQYEKALELYRTHGVKYVDSVIASIPEVQSKKWIIVSYDADFKKLPVLWKTPKQILKTVHL